MRRVRPSGSVVAQRGCSSAPSTRHRGSRYGLSTVCWRHRTCRRTCEPPSSNTSGKGSQVFMGTKGIGSKYLPRGSLPDRRGWPYQKRQMKLTDGYQSMASAPRDRSFVIVKLAARRPHHRRKHWEHIVRWSGVGINPRWRSFIVSGMVIKDEDCVGWRPMDEEAWRVVQERRDGDRGRCDRAKAARRSTST
jgi:hypothetical protein